VLGNDNVIWAEIIPNKSDCTTLCNRFYIPDPDNAGVGILISIKTSVFSAHKFIM